MLLLFHLLYQLQLSSLGGAIFYWISWYLWLIIECRIIAILVGGLGFAFCFYKYNNPFMYIILNLIQYLLHQEIMMVHIILYLLKVVILS